MVKYIFSIILEAHIFMYFKIKMIINKLITQKDRHESNAFATKNIKSFCNLLGLTKIILEPHT